MVPVIFIKKLLHNKILTTQIFIKTIYFFKHIIRSLNAIIPPKYKALFLHPSYHPNYDHASNYEKLILANADMVSDISDVR